MAITKSSDLNSLFNSIYEDSIFVAREQNVMTNLVFNYSATGWMARVIPQRASITAQAVAEGVDFSNPTTFSKSTLATLTPGEKMCQVLLTDIDIETDPENARTDAATEMGGAIATKIDKDLITLFASFSTDKGPGAGQTATLAKFAAAISVLRQNLVPNPIKIVLHPYCWHDIFIELGQPAATKVLLGDVANEALRSFFVGDWLLADWFVSANIIASGTDAVSGIFNPQALAFDSRKPPTMEAERDASLRAWELNMVAGYAYGVRRSTFGVKYTSDVTEPT
jgi:hypothetical protein